MTQASNQNTHLTPQMLLRAYSCGIFPMAEEADDPTLYWVEPEMRGILPLNNVHVPQRLARTVRQGKFDVKIDSDFNSVIDGCAGMRPGRMVTWINQPIRDLYNELFRLGHCHTVETWRDGKLVGGLYGVSLGAVFFGESMFSTERDASKVALVHLAARLIYGGFKLLDTQFITTHLQQFGAREIAQEDFQLLLSDALEISADFHRLSYDCAAKQILDIVAGAKDGA
ncbi:MAG: leucyl/phenylalanyl-tRNA--protein transferase [Alphaproteobacteria bacterium]